MSSSRCAIALHRSSPTWHRRARTRRSAARRKLQAGGVPTRKQLSLLIGHHGTCEASRVSLQATQRGMTKGWKSKPQWEGQAWLSADSSTYRLWPGAKSPAQPKAPWKEGKGGSKSGGIPGYASRRLPDTQAMASVAASAQAGSSGMVTRVQQALNHARKAEARVKKLNADKEKREQQWALWERDMKVAWLREKAQYGRDMEQIDREIVSAMTAQEEARTALRFTFETSAPENTEVPAAMEVEIEDGAAEWFALRHSWEQEAKPDWEGVLERALGHRQAMSQQGNQSSSGGQHARPSDGSLLSPEVAAQLLQSTLGSLPPRLEVAQGHLDLGPGAPGSLSGLSIVAQCGGARQHQSWWLSLTQSGFQAEGRRACPCERRALAARSYGDRYRRRISWEARTGPAICLTAVWECSAPRKLQCRFGGAGRGDGGPRWDKARLGRGCSLCGAATGTSRAVWEWTGWPGLSVSPVGTLDLGRPSCVRDVGCHPAAALLHLGSVVRDCGFRVHFLSRVSQQCACIAPCVPVQFSPSAILEAGLGSGDLAPLPALSLPYGWGVPPHWACVACPPATILLTASFVETRPFAISLDASMPSRLPSFSTAGALRALFCSFQMCSLVSFPGPTLAPLAV